MTDYKSPWNRNQQINFEDDPIRKSNPIATLFWIVVSMGLMIWMLHALVNAIVVEQETAERAYLQNFERPEAYRKASPTHEQLWALDHLTDVSKVAHAERQQP